jgi:methionine sulfoxide reductase heme-binding subunit
MRSNLQPIARHDSASPISSGASVERKLSPVPDSIIPGSELPMNPRVVAKPVVGQPARNLDAFVQYHFNTIRLASSLIWLIPAAFLLSRWLSDSLGEKPLSYLLQFTGRWALIMLLVTLTVTPARRLLKWVAQTSRARFGKRMSDWNWLIRLRRQFGLFGFFYACLHFGTYAVLDSGRTFEMILADVRGRPYLLPGFAAFVLLIPMAATANSFAMKKLGRVWQKIHAAIYLIAILVIAHFWMQMKSGQFDFLPYALVLALLFGARVYAWRTGDRGTGMEVKPR